MWCLFALIFCVQSQLLPSNNLGNILPLGGGVCNGKKVAIGKIWKNKDQCFDPYEESRVLCGTDGHTYLTPWEFETARCINPSLDVFAEGPCDCYLKLQTCSMTSQPVCGDDAKLYQNLCHFTNNVCQREVEYVYGFPPSGCFNSGKDCCHPNNLRLTTSDQRTLPVDALRCLRPAGKCDNSWLQMGKCLYFSSAGKTGARMLTECGELQKNKCNAKCKPVCGNDYVMYANDCVFNWARGLDSALQEMDCSVISSGSPLWEIIDVEDNGGGSYWPSDNGWGDISDIRFCPSDCRMYYDGCNVCWCNPNGLAESCTDNDCDVADSPECLQILGSSEETPFIDLIKNFGDIMDAIRKARQIDPFY